MLDSATGDYNAALALRDRPFAYTVRRFGRNTVASA